jgi:predicted RNA polymerase sigma factor
VRQKTDLEDLLRPLAPQVLGALLRRYGNWEMCEDALQEALLEVSDEWARHGVPAHPRGFLVTVANRRMIDQIRSESGIARSAPWWAHLRRSSSEFPVPMRTSTGMTR